MNISLLGKFAIIHEIYIYAYAIVLLHSHISIFGRKHSFVVTSDLSILNLIVLFSIGMEPMERYYPTDLDALKDFC